MKICIVSPVSLNLLDDEIGQPLPQGYRYPLGAMFVKEFLRLGHEVVVVTNTVDVAEIRRWASGKLTIVATPRRRPRQFCLDFYRHERRAMLAAIRLEKPDIVHAHWTYEFAAVAIDSGLPYVVTARDYPPIIFKHTKEFYRFFRMLYSFYIIPRIKVLVSNSPYLADKIERTYRKPSAAVIPNGIVSDFSEVKHYDSSNESPFVVSIVANWDRRKNVAAALKAFSKAVKTVPDMELHLFGHGLGEGEDAETYARKHRLSEGIHFHGFKSQSDIRDFHLKRTDLLLHPSLEESFGMTILEAMELGIPSLGGKEAGAVPWVIGDGGVTVDIRQPDEISEQLILLAQNRPLVCDLGRKAHERARQKFSLHQVALEYLGLYEKTFRDRGSK